MINKLSTAAQPQDVLAQKREQMQKAAKAFEAVFLRQMIGSMRQAKLSDDILSGSGTEQFREMSDAKLADSMADKGGFGIAELLLAQFGGVKGGK